MQRAVLGSLVGAAILWLITLGQATTLYAQGEWEMTPQSQQALARGLAWLARAQGPEGNWNSNDLGLVSTGVLAFLADGHLPGRGRYGETVQRGLEYVLRNAKPSGLLNIAEGQRGMYNHGLSTFMLGQVYGMTGDSRVGAVLDRALKMTMQTQCDDGGWDYQARRQERGHDLSLAVMQALALRSAVDSGLEVAPEAVELAIKSVRAHYTARGCPREASEEEQQKHPGQFTYTPGQGEGTAAMAAAGIVCLQEFGQYDDWRIAKNIERIALEMNNHVTPQDQGQNHRICFNDAYTLYYVAQAIYQVGGDPWRQFYPRLRDNLVVNQHREPNRPDEGSWNEGERVSGMPGKLYTTAVGCFVLAIPNRYLPILQEGKIESLQKQFGVKKDK
jgi:hypothetical protein